MIAINLGNHLPKNIDIGDVLVIGTGLYQVNDFESENDGFQSQSSPKDNLKKYTMYLKKIFDSDGAY